MASAIYLLTSPSGKMYIGQSMNIEGRMASYSKYNAPTQRALFFAIKKHGFSNFTIEYLYRNEKPLMNERVVLDAIEKFAIKKFKTTEKGVGYNLQGGGTSGYSHSKETTKLIGDAQRGELNHRYGKSHTNEWKADASIRMKNSSHNLKYRSKEDIASDRVKQRIATSKLTYQYGTDGKFIREWRSQREAHKGLGVGGNSLWYALIEKDGYNFSGGYCWSWSKSDYIEPKIKQTPVAVSVYDMDGSLIKTFEYVSEYRRSPMIINTEVVFSNGKTRFIGYAELFRNGLIDGVKRGPRYGAIVGTTTRKRQSEFHLGEIPWNKGVKMRESSRLKMIETKRLRQERLNLEQYGKDYQF